MIAGSRIGIGGREIYYYSEVTGTRYLTFPEFRGLGSLDDAGLRSHLAEISRHLGRRNAAGNPEVAFFGAGPGSLPRRLHPHRLRLPGSGAPAPTYEELVEKFRSAVRPVFLQDDPENARMEERHGGGAHRPGERAGDGADAPRAERGVLHADRVAARRPHRGRGAGARPGPGRRGGRRGERAPAGREVTQVHPQPRAGVRRPGVRERGPGDRLPLPPGRHAGAPRRLHRGVQAAPRPRRRS